MSKERGGRPAADSPTEEARIKVARLVDGPNGGCHDCEDGASFRFLSGLIGQCEVAGMELWADSAQFGQILLFSLVNLGRLAELVLLSR